MKFKPTKHKLITVYSTCFIKISLHFSRRYECLLYDP